MQIETKSKSNINSKTKDLVTTSLLIAVVFVATYVIHFPAPFSLNSGGLIHLGNVMLFMAAIVFGKKKGAIAGAFGMGLFDLLSGYAIWAPFTFIIRGVMGYMIGYIANSHHRDGNNMTWNIIALTLSSIWMIAGYYIANIILFQNWVAAFSSIPGDLTQLAFGFILGIPATVAVKKTKVFDNY